MKKQFDKMTVEELAANIEKAKECIEMTDELKRSLKDDVAYMQERLNELTSNQNKDV